MEGEGCLLVRQCSAPNHHKCVSCPSAFLPLCICNFAVWGRILFPLPCVGMGAAPIFTGLKVISVRTTAQIFLTGTLLPVDDCLHVSDKKEKGKNCAFNGNDGNGNDVRPGALDTVSRTAGRPQHLLVLMLLQDTSKTLCPQDHPLI